MTKFRLRIGMTALATLAVVAVCATAAPRIAMAAPVLLTNGGSIGPFGMGVTETRQTHFEALNNVTLTQLGAEIDPGRDNEDVRWTIYNSDSGKTFGTQVFSQIFDLGTDVGLTTYDSGLSVSLSAGFYILEMQALGGPTIMMERYNEADQGLPFVTSDGNFRVTDGAGNFTFSNSILPAFSLSTDSVVAVPAPVSAPLFAAMFGAFLILRRRII